ncbi:Ger(x)C family spore germination protein [Paenibacillus sp. Marseille-Q4541]|uniref:Ger(x)C family spore germination protein n=1 Tax=Paenibacillus sp. Marseille-Q4541 TaxID=2831522 RepID=UPI001BAD0ED2|nr:Ger(x)C family spore germination protein [Paenibacillus sp. Marseille-Q4541]
MKQIICKIIAVVLMTSLLAGCWDSVELKERLIVTGLAVDRGDKPGIYNITFQAAVPTELSGGQGQGTTPVFVFTGQGRTLQEVLSKMSQDLPKIISLSHVAVLVISDDLAQKVGIGKFIDYIERDPKTRITMQVLIAKETLAKNILSVTSPVGPVTANNLVNKVRYTNRDYSHNYPNKIDDVIRGMITPGGGPAISGAVVKGSETQGSRMENINTVRVPTHVSVDGMALFKGDKLVGWMEGDQGLGLTIIRNKVHNAAMNISCPHDPSGTMAIATSFSKTKIEASIQDGTPYFHLVVRQKGIISEADCPVNLTSGEAMQIYEKTWSEKTRQIVLSAIEQAQRSKTDVLGFGYALKKQRSHQYKEWEEAEDWDEVFSRSKVKVTIQSVVMHTQTRNNPYSTGGED